MTDKISKRQVQTAWNLSVVAADWHEKQGTDLSCENMLEATDYAEQLQAKYDAQQCPHKNVIHHFEPDDTITICSDCGGWIDDQGEVYRYSDPLETIF